MNKKVVVIGGSAGSFTVVNQILHKLSADYTASVVLCLHRLRDVRKGFIEALSVKSKLPVVEAVDKEYLKPGNVYLAPANYHLSMEPEGLIALSSEEAMNYSRPAIDITFEAVGHVYGDKALGVLLSGANRDGAMGLRLLRLAGGDTIVQDPEDASMSTMPKAALSMYTEHRILSAAAIAQTLAQQP